MFKQITALEDKTLSDTNCRCNHLFDLSILEQNKMKESNIVSLIDDGCKGCSLCSSETIFTVFSAKSVG